MSITVKGLDNFQKNIKQLQKNAADLHGERKVPLTDVFSPAFMQKHTDHESLELMFEAAGYKIETEEDLKAVPDDEWDAFVRTTTKFTSWQAMQAEAAKEYIGKKLLDKLSQ